MTDRTLSLIEILTDVARPAKEISPNALVVVLDAALHAVKSLTKPEPPIMRFRIERVIAFAAILKLEEAVLSLEIYGQCLESEDRERLRDVCSKISDFLVKYV